MAENSASIFFGKISKLFWSLFIANYFQQIFFWENFPHFSKLKFCYFSLKFRKTIKHFRKIAIKLLKKNSLTVFGFGKIGLVLLNSVFQNFLLKILINWLNDIDQFYNKLIKKIKLEFNLKNAKFQNVNWRNLFHILTEFIDILISVINLLKQFIDIVKNLFVY